MIKSNQSEQRIANEILLRCFRRNESFLSALTKIKGQMFVSSKFEHVLEARWAIWELYGDDIDD